MLTKNQQKIADLLIKLRRKLALEYPPYHWKHSKVFTGFWNLADNFEDFLEEVRKKDEDKRSSNQSK